MGGSTAKKHTCLPCSARAILALVCALAFVLLLCGCAVSTTTTSTASTTTLPPNEVDVVTFLVAFQEGKADQYLGLQVKGAGREFSNYIMGIGEQGPLTITVGTIDSAGQVVLLDNWENWSDAEAAGQKMLMLELQGASVERKQPDVSDPALMFPTYEFSGRYNGATTTKMQLVFKTGEQPAAYMVPVLEDAIAR